MNNEEKYLGCLLQDNSILINHPVSAEYFQTIQCRNLYELIEKMIVEGKPADIVSVSENEKLPKIVSKAWISSLVDIPPILAKSLSLELSRAFKRHKFNSWLADLNSLPIDEAIEKAENGLISFVSNENKKPFKSLKECAASWAGEMLDGGGQSLRVYTKQKILDDNWILDCGGFHIIAGRPGMGKTSLAICLVDLLAQQNVPSAVFSLEMSDASLITKLASQWSQVPTKTLLNNFSYNQDAVMEELAKRYDYPIFISDDCKQTIETIVLKSQYAKNNYGIKIVVIDHMGFIKSTQRFQSRESEVTYISQSLKNLAKQLNIPVILLSQLNREVEQQKDKRPLLSNLRESGSLEQDADTVALIFRQEYYDLQTNKETPDELKGVVEINIAKQRKIGPKTIFAKWKPEVNTYTWGAPKKEIYDYTTSKFRTDE